MSGYDQKYTDIDVRQDPFLLAAAVKYARSYIGEFDFMTAASTIVHDRGTLPIAVARGVLNCMRADPRIANDLPTPHNGHTGLLEKFEFTPVSISSHQVQTQKRFLRTRTNVKCMYTWSRNISDDPDKIDKFHYVSVSSEGGFHIPQMNFTLCIKSLCGVVRSTTFLLGNNPPSNRELCGSCINHIEGSYRKSIR